MLRSIFLRLVVICVVCLNTTVFSQFVLQGTVTDNGAEYLGNGAEPVEGVQVTITDQTNANRFFSSYTDEAGHYYIEITQTCVDDLSISAGSFRLLQNYPNPFNPSTEIRYELSKPAPISIEIYNVLGQHIKTLVEGFHSTSGQITWNGTNDLGQGVPAGLYIYSLKAGAKRVNRKMLLIDSHIGNFDTPLLPSISSNHTGNFKLQKQLSDQYTLTVTGDNIATYNQKDLKITACMTVDITVMRTLTDIDGNVYTTVKIGDQWWTVENLKVTHYSNGDTIPNITNNSEWKLSSTGARCAYDNEENNADTYGYLYNWYVIGDSRNIAPQGWHVPTDDECKKLEMTLGMSQSETDAFGWRHTDKGGKLKESGLNHWNSPNTGATNESGFTAIPAGFRLSYGTFDLIGCSSYFWSSSEYVPHKAWLRTLSHLYSDVCHFHDFNQVGYSIRLIRD